MTNGWRFLFLVAPDCHAASGHYSALWRRHFYEGFEDCDVRVETPCALDFSFAYGNAAPPATTGAFQLANERLHRQLLAAMDRGELDAVISYARDREISTSLVEEITRRGIPWVNFYCDSLGQFHDVEQIARAASLNWFPESAAIPRYRALSRPHLCRPYVLNPVALPVVNVAETLARKVGFVGMPTTNRATLLSLLRILGCPVEIRGYGWTQSDSSAFGGQNAPLSQKLARLLLEPHRLERVWRRVAWQQLKGIVQGPLSDVQLPRFLASCQIVLGLNDTRTPSGELQSYMKFRDLEMPGHGCCYLTQANPDIHTALVPDKEVLTFGNLWEARSKIRFYSRRPELCREIGQKARARILREHTWKNRLHELQAALA